MKRFALLIASLCLVGCNSAGNARLIVVRDGMDQAISTVRLEHKDWSQKLHDGVALPKLTDEDLKVRLNAHKAYEGIVSDSKAKDK
jgi:hypothetical protein